MAHHAALYGNLELVKWLCGEGGFAMDERVTHQSYSWPLLAARSAARGGNLELVQWLRGEGCPWDIDTCFWAVKQGHVEMLRWARENGCPWSAETRDRAAAELGYTDDFGNLVDHCGRILWGNHPIPSVSSTDEYSDEHADDGDAGDE